jgi:ketosteroid isomerase-like protein
MQPIIGSSEIEKYLSQNTTQQWDPIFADASEAGDLGYTYGSINSEGKAEKAYYMRIWKKQSDGLWKVVLDVNNVSDES